MPCYSPLKGYLANKVNPSGKRSVVFNAREGFTDKPIEIPCGQCIGCRLERSRQWAIRCVHEAQMHEHNVFLTLTYNPEHLPKGGTLVKRDFQLFIKRLRKHYGKNIRYFHCGEYGENLGRPHYHACMFNLNVKDKKLFKENRGTRLYTSSTIEKIWGKGFVTLGEVTFESAAYVARYITKKVNGKKALEFYKGKEPEYTTMSRRPGIAKKWFDKYSSDVYPSDSIVVRGIETKPPKYYDNNYMKIEEIKLARKIKAKEKALDNTPERLQVKQNIKLKQYSQLKRSYENEESVYDLRRQSGSLQSPIYSRVKRSGS